MTTQAIAWLDQGRGIRAERAAASEPQRIRFEPDNVRQGLMRLVLTLVEAVRELLERQALRRMEAGGLTDQEIERVGLTFMRLSQEVQRLRAEFDLSDEDLNLDLGPLGRLR
ncbi:MAG: gas vesicle protein K [Planctomycetia bacterium]|nr:gas vesicle protein K [Planctomycetia bacterium]